VRRAHSFKITFCDDPTCGPHLIGCDERGVPFCEITMTIATTVRMIENIQKVLYEKATIRSELFNPPKEGREP